MIWQTIMVIYAKEYFHLLKKIVIQKFQIIQIFQKKMKLLQKSHKEKIPDLQNLMNKQDLNQYIKEVINFSFSANKYFNDLKPWDLKKLI